MVLGLGRDFWVGCRFCGVLVGFVGLVVCVPEVLSLGLVSIGMVCVVEVCMWCIWRWECGLFFDRRLGL